MQVISPIVTATSSNDEVSYTKYSQLY